MTLDLFILCSWKITNLKIKCQFLRTGTTIIYHGYSWPSRVIRGSFTHVLSLPKDRLIFWQAINLWIMDHDSWYFEDDSISHDIYRWWIIPRNLVSGRSQITLFYWPRTDMIMVMKINWTHVTWHEPSWFRIRLYKPEISWQ